jgi:hypothetical protein
MPVPLQVLKRFWVALVLVVLVAGYAVYWFQNAFYDTGYAPEQPIAFYHKVHAGDLHIDCKYCHFNAERGKHAAVPPMSVCLGCHRNVTTENEQYKKEIANLLAIADKGSYQIDGVTYHGEKNDDVVYDGGVVHWQRVHKLPDHVYFSHQWHVRAGVACQTCHGPVQEMTVLRQYSDLTMSWCLDCHRKSNYVGGRRYDPADPTTFAVGTGSRSAQLDREEPDAVVDFVARQVKTSAAPQAAAAPQAEGEQPQQPKRILRGEGDREAMVKTVVDAHETDTTTLPPQLRAVMRERLRDLPVWRLADLPETHRAFYQDPASFQNAPTQCNTCHQ